MYLAQPENKGHVDVVEIFGGESGVGKLCIRRRLVRGENFDLVTGFDLTDKKQQEEVVKYFNTFKPLVALLGPPMYRFWTLVASEPVYTPGNMAEELGNR